MKSRVFFTTVPSVWHPITSVEVRAHCYHCHAYLASAFVKRTHQRQAESAMTRRNVVVDHRCEPAVKRAA